MSTATTPITLTTTLPSWVGLLVNLGASIGATFAGRYATLIADGVQTVETVIQSIQAANAAKKAGTAVNPADLAVPIFVSSVLTALEAGVAAGKIPATDAAELSKAVIAMQVQDTAAKAAVDYSTIGPIAPMA